MKKLVMSLMFVVVGCSAFALKPSNTNLLLNPGFENTAVDPWTRNGGQGVIAIDTDAYTGMQSLRSYDEPAGVYGIYQKLLGWLPEDQNADYRVGMWHKLKNPLDTPKGFGFNLQCTWGAGKLLVKTSPTLTAGPDWQYYTGVFRIDGGTTYTHTVAWLTRVATTGPDILYDDTMFYKIAGPEPVLTSPAMGVREVDLNATLQWTPADVSQYPSPSDPNVFAVRTAQYLYIQAGSDDFTNVTPITLGADASSFEVGPLNMSTRYYWTVDTGIDGSGTNRSSDPNSNDPNTLILPYAYHFTTKTPAPVIDIYDSVVLTTAMLPAVLSPTISDLDNNLASIMFSAEDPNVTLQNLNLTDLYHPTIEVVTAQPGVYAVTLTVTDVSGNTATASANVSVFADACEAARAASTWTGYSNLDRAEPRDCRVDILDFAALAAEWLDDRTLQSQAID